MPMLTVRPAWEPVVPQASWCITPSGRTSLARLHRRPAQVTHVATGVGAICVAASMLAASAHAPQVGRRLRRRLHRRHLRCRIRMGAAPNESETDEEALWRRAYKLELERSTLLRPDAVSAGAVSTETEPSSCVKPPNGWKAAFELLRDENETVVKDRQQRLAAAAAKAAAERRAQKSSSSVDPSFTSSPATTGAGELTEPTVKYTVNGTKAPKAADDQQDFFETLAKKTDWDDDELPKVISLWNLIDIAEIDDELIDKSIDLVYWSGLPTLSAFFGLSNVKGAVPSLSEVQQALDFNDIETKRLFQLDTVQEYGGRVYEFVGQLTDADAAEKNAQSALEDVFDGGPDASTLVGQLQSRLDSKLATRVELFALPGDEKREARFFTFIREDLPLNENDELVPSVVAFLGGAVITLCNTQILSILLLSTDWLSSNEMIDLLGQLMSPDPTTVAPIGPLLLLSLVATTAARTLAAEQHKMRITQFPYPSQIAGHLGCIWSAQEFIPSQKAMLDVAAAGPAAALLVSSIMVALGYQEISALDPGEAPLELPAIQLPAALVAAMGYEVPKAGEEPLLTLGSSVAALTGPDGVLVPVNALLLSGAVGVTVASISLLPIGAFDGYFVAQAAFGREVASVLELIALAGLAVEASQNDARSDVASEVALLWLVQMLVVNKRESMPPKDGITTPDSGRQLLATALLAVSGAVLLRPF